MTSIPYTLMHGEAYLTRPQAEVYVGRGEKWLQARVEAGKLKKYTLDDTHTRYYKRAELDALIKPQVVEEHEAAYDETDYLKYSDVAHRLSVSTGYIYKLVHEGKLHATNISGKVGRGAVYRIHKNEYARFVREREQAEVTTR